MKCMEIEGLPPNALELSATEIKLWAARIKLFRVVEWYNYLIQRTEPCELDLVREEINAFDKVLEPALASVKWTNYGNFMFNEFSIQSNQDDGVFNLFAVQASSLSV